MITDWEQLEEIWLVDFEFLGRRTWIDTHKEGNRPDPICMVAIELLTGRTIELWGSDFGRSPPYRTDEKVAFVAFYASAELGCHLALGWPRPANVIDLFVEFRNRLNGREPPAGFGLLGALIAHGLDGSGAEEKEDMRALILRGGPWTYAERIAILKYCLGDVLALQRLLPRMMGYIDLPRALIRGRYMWAAAWMEHIGTPIDTAALELIVSNWENIKLALIEKVDAKYGVYDGINFSYKKFADYLQRVGLLDRWPRTITGQLSVEGDDFEEQAKSFPELRDLKELKSSTDKLKLASLVVGDDGRNRTILSAFRSKTGRNQPSNSKFVFLGDTWLRSVIKPEKGWAVAYLDWEQQEFGIAAALSGDPNMIRAYTSGDCYLEFAKMAGAVPSHIDKLNYDAEEHGGVYIDVRHQYKQCVLAVQYGQGPLGLAKRTGISIIDARELMQRHRETFRRFWQWSGRMVDAATFRLEIPTVFGWWLDTTESYDRSPLAHGKRARCSVRTIQNFEMQACAGDMLRVACIYGEERGIRLCAPIHDALLIEARDGEIERAVAKTEACMRHASRDVLGGFELRIENKIVRWPDRFADPRGNYVRPNGERGMWNIVADMVGIES
jgi:DNA polymerase I